ncbi:RNA polymerase sigma factor SigJ [Glaciimonas soli]|uniref:Sigma-70 family RNA polymerase sigma factor n=1 Tax=Glaciimonas soli TaxID=2590999 RepID=A0A843YSC2_9BURK|nr:RNA polymerase sigma factor SigJ [Glaciimonas soli]MQR00897.1 sigma-70 family RNA polymerase sigma factor [Glaciimonas soli]
MHTQISAFHQHRKRLFGIAYRMLGTHADAEDVLQDAYLRWHALSAQPENPEAWLVTVVTRLCIDRLRKVKLERENYIGAWLPEPLIATDIDHHSPEWMVEFASDVSTAFLVVLERLGPEERAAFLLHDVFELDYSEIANMLDKTEASCRQLVSRARGRVRQSDAKPVAAVKHVVSPEMHLQLLQQFMVASKSGDRAHLEALFTSDATFTGDGGGVVVSALRILHGPDRIARLFHAIARQHGDILSFQVADINGEPGILRYGNGKLDSVLSFVLEADEHGKTRIKALYALRNPHKLLGVDAAFRIDEKN